MSIVLFKRLDKPYSLFGRITEVLESNKLALGARPYSIVFGFLRNVNVSLGCDVKNEFSIFDNKEVISTYIKTMPTVLSITGTLLRARTVSGIAEQTLSDARDLRPPTSAIYGPYAQLKILQRWVATKQLLNVSYVDKYENLIIDKLDINDTPETGAGEYDVTLSLTRVKNTFKKDIKSVLPEDNFYQQQGSFKPRSDTAGSSYLGNIIV